MKTIQPGFMRDDKTFLAKAILVAGAAILLIVEGLFTLSSVITKLIGLPLNLNLQPVLKLVGSAILIAGLMLVLWLLKYRKPSTMIVSTYFTFVKMFTRSPISGVGDRTEPLILSGPQKYVRHPLYLGALATFLGWALITGSTSYVVGVAFVLLWFRFVQIPFEERELRAIFGDQYARYSDEVPMLIPFTKRKRKDDRSKSQTC